MDQKREVYQWSRPDRALHLLPAIPLVAFYVGATYLLVVESIYLAGAFLLLWVGVSFAVAGICAGCPYRGGFCPDLCQGHFAPFLSAAIHRDRKRDSDARSFRVNLVLPGVLGFGSYVFAFYWLFSLHWQEHPAIVLTLLALLIVHMPLSFFLLCPKCSYNDTCPMANVHKAFKGASDSDREQRSRLRQGRTGPTT
jgi:hypothetical protein